MATRIKRVTVVLCVTIGSFLVFTYFGRRREAGGAVQPRNVGLEAIYEDQNKKSPAADQSAVLKMMQGESMESQSVQAERGSTQERNTEKVLPPQHQHHLDSAPEVIRHDMEQCSLSLGVSSDTLTKSTDTLDKISIKASNFLLTLFSIVPRTFLTNYKNFCFYSNIRITKDIIKQLTNHLLSHQSTSTSDMAHKISIGDTSTVLCLPHFFIAGFPKCGTTSVSVALRQHAGIASPLVKEPHWWGRLANLEDPNPDYNRLVIMSYIVNFHDATQNSSQHMTYDGSQCTLWDSNFFVNSQEYCAMPLVLSRVLPHAKFIVIMRNPVSRLFSHYLWSCSHRFGRLSQWPAEIISNATAHFHEEVIYGINYFKDCLKTLSAYECTNILRHLDKEVGCGGVGFRLSISLYGVHLSKWMQFYPKEQFLFLRMEDMSYPVPFMSKMTTFLGLSPVTPALAAELLSHKANAQKLSTKEEIVMREDTRKLLEDFYRPYNTKLAKLVGDWTFLWQDS